MAGCFQKRKSARVGSESRDSVLDCGSPLPPLRRTVSKAAEGCRNPKPGGIKAVQDFRPVHWKAAVVAPLADTLKPEFRLNFQLSTFNFQPLNIPVPILSYAVIALAAYLLGSIPTGWLAGRARGIDIRTVGSGNMGATNVFRTLGKTAGVIVLVVDGLKGYAACIWLCDGALAL